MSGLALAPSAAKFTMKRAAYEGAQEEWEAAKADYKAARKTLRSKLAAHFGARYHPRLKDFFD